MIWCEQRFDNAKSCLCRANCPVVLSCAVCFCYPCYDLIGSTGVVLSCAVCFCYRCYVLIGSTGVICVWEKTGGRERSNTCRKIKKKKSSTQQHVLSYLVLLYVRNKAHSAARHSNASEGLGTAPHGSARRYAALLGYIIKNENNSSCEIEDFVETLYEAGLI